MEPISARETECGLKCDSEYRPGLYRSPTRTNSLSIWYTTVSTLKPGRTGGPSPSSDL